MPKIFKITIGLAVLGILIAVFGIGLILVEKNKTKEIKNGAEEISDFESCAAAGYPILETYPEQCKTPDGRTFVKQISQPPPMSNVQPICINKCGDGVCQEIVCQGSGCPCAESPKTCPQDCG